MSKGKSGTVERIALRAISPASVRVVGTLTNPRTYGVYRLTAHNVTGRRYRFGNYPIRLHELQREFGTCTLEYLFTSRSDAERVAVMLSNHGA